jgi:epoxyqueuosine reductase
MVKLDELVNWAYKNSYRISWGHTGHLIDAYNEFDKKSQSGEFNDIQTSIFQNWGSFHQLNEDEMSTIILIATSTSGKTRKIIFDCNGIKINTLVPPWYSYDEEEKCSNTINENLSNFLSKYGYKTRKLLGPYKYLSAKLGLGRYGRNNLVYVDGLGSYARIAGFITNAELTPNRYPEINSDRLVLENCATCTSCMKKCPTQAIDNDQFLLHVDRCLSYHSELIDAGIEFSKYAEQDCLVGCLNCQDVCPYNNGFTAAENISLVSFNREETSYIVGEYNQDIQIIEKVVEEKLEKVGLSRHKSYIVRNLRVHINSKITGR